MKLVTYDATTVAQERKTGAYLSLSRVGASTISKDAAKLMRLDAGDMICFNEDEDNPGDWYVCISTGGFELREYGKGGGGLLFNSSGMVNKLLDSLGVDEVRVRFNIGKEPVKVDGDDVEYWPVITKMPIVVKREKRK